LIRCYGICYFPWAAVANGKRLIESHYPTQAKVRLEWGTQDWLPVWQKLLWASPDFLLSLVALANFDWIGLFSRRL
jgi:hypothetical protein